MKPYPPTMKEKERYIVFDVNSDASFARSQVSKALWDAVFDSIGKKGAEETSFWVMDFDEDKQKGILRANSKSVDKIRACVALLDNIENNKTIIIIKRVTGTIKKAKDIIKEER